MIDMAISSKRIWKNENVQKKQYKSGISFCYHVGTMVACFGAESIYDRRLGLGKI